MVEGNNKLLNVTFLKQSHFELYYGKLLTINDCFNHKMAKNNYFEEKTVIAKLSVSQRISSNKLKSARKPPVFI